MRFARGDAQTPRMPVDIVQPEACDLTGTQSQAREEHEDGTIAEFLGVVPVESASTRSTSATVKRMGSAACMA